MASKNINMISERIVPDPVYISSSRTGGYWTFPSRRSKKPFKNPLNYYAKLSLRETDIVADIGAYVGEYALYALRQGVQRVICYEPTPDTFAVLQLNVIPGMELIQKAVVGDASEQVRLYLSKGVGVTNSIAKSTGKRESIFVPAIQYEDAVREATVVKIDVEGAEYKYRIIQPQLRAIIIEFHPLAEEDWRKKVEIIINNLESAGFLSIERPTFASGWNLTGCWERRE